MPDRTVLAVKKQMMKRLILYVCAFFCGVSVPSQAQTLPYRNPALSVEERVEDLLGRMTLEEKVAQLRHIHSENVFDGQKLSKENMETFCRKMSFGFVEGLPLYSENCRDNFMALQKYMVEETRLGIPVIITTEALHGMAQDGATIFPQNIALGSTFNRNLPTANRAPSAKSCTQPVSVKYWLPASTWCATFAGDVWKSRMVKTPGFARKWGWQRPKGIGIITSHPCSSIMALTELPWAG